MKTKWMILGGCLGLVACVTETPAEKKELFKPPAPAITLEQTSGGPTNAAATPGAIIINCHVQDTKGKPRLPCGPMSLKYINDITLEENSVDFKGAKFALSKVRESSYTIEVTAKACGEKRMMKGLTFGTVMGVQFPAKCLK